MTAVTYICIIYFQLSVLIFLLEKEVHYVKN